MKHLFWSLLSVLVLSITACEKEDETKPVISTTAVNTSLLTGTWRVTYYWDTDHEETTSFNGYTFTFAANNVITAAKTGSTVSGTWSTGKDDSKTKLILNFTVPQSFVEISEDWHVVELTATKIKLQHVSGGNGGTDVLTFEKN